MSMVGFKLGTNPEERMLTQRQYEDETARGRIDYLKTCTMFRMRVSVNLLHCIEQDLNCVFHDNVYSDLYNLYIRDVNLYNSLSSSSIFRCYCSSYHSFISIFVTIWTLYCYMLSPLVYTASDISWVVTGGISERHKSKFFLHVSCGYDMYPSLRCVMHVPLS